MGSFGYKHVSFLNDPWLVLREFFLDVSIPNMILYDFSTYNMNFTQNKHIKLNETCLDTQGYFKAHLPNDMDVLGRLSSKHHETWHTSNILYNNTFNDLKTSWITHTDIEPQMRRLGDLVVKCLGWPLTFDFQWT